MYNTLLQPLWTSFPAESSASSHYVRTVATGHPQLVVDDGSRASGEPAMRAIIAVQ